MPEKVYTYILSPSRMQYAQIVPRIQSPHLRIRSMPPGNLEDELGVREVIRLAKVDLSVQVRIGRSLAGVKGRRPSTFCLLVFSNFINTSVPNPQSFKTLISMRRAGLI